MSGCMRPDERNLVVRSRDRALKGLRKNTSNCSTAKMKMMRMVCEIFVQVATASRNKQIDVLNE